MKKSNLQKRLAQFEFHHSILLFFLIVCLTILIVRITGQFYNPNPIILSFELHHFDYGLILLLITCLFLLFDKKTQPLYHYLAAISFGLILDEAWFIRKYTLPSDPQVMSFYNSTLPSVLILIILITIILLFINHRIKKHLKKQTTKKK